MDEQSHKDEMRAALRGDFERLRTRREGGAVPERPQPATAVAGELADSTRSPVVERPSWFERLRGRH